MTLPTVARFKIGINKGKRRIWIDGARLKEAGFTGGSSYYCFSSPGHIVLSLTPIDNARIRKVTGRPDGKPIIDMLGRDVENAFPTGDYVAVLFNRGRINVLPEAKETVRNAA